MMETKTPELNKILANKEKSVLLTEFIDWLKEHHRSICYNVFQDRVMVRLLDPPHYVEDEWVPISDNFEQLFADFFEIDLVKAEAERVAMLAEIRERNYMV